MVLKLDEIDKRILFELDKNCRIPETKLAKIINRSKESVRYRINKMLQEKLIDGFSILIDPTRLGFVSGKIYLNLSNKPQKKKEFLDFVKKDRRLFWLGIAEGTWNIGLTYFVKSNSEFYELKNELFSKFEELILESWTAMLVEVDIFDKSFLWDGARGQKIVFNNLEKVKLDQIEKNILNELFKDGTISITRLAINSKTTVDIIRTRIKRLEEKQILVRYLPIINFTKLGYQFYKTFLYFKNLNKSEESRVIEYCKRNPNIIHLIKQVSPWDMELEIMCENYNEYLKIVSDLTEKFSNIIHKTETAIIGEDYLFPAKQLLLD